MYISGWHTVDEWKELSARLVVGGTPELWTEAFHNFFFERLETRYFVPARAIAAIGEMKGEGFSMVTIQCSLIEFLQATREGRKYRILQEGETEDDLAADEYGSSGPMFKRFLRENEPFSDVFTSNNKANDFYDCVRNGLLHEARTKKKWIILADSDDGSFFEKDGSAKILYRNDFQRELEEYVQRYGQELLGSPDLQDKFVRKIDGLCVT